MGARQKLNEAHLTGSAILAGVTGLATGSWLVFIATLVVLVALGIHAGRIRPDSRRRR